MRSARNGCSWLSNSPIRWLRGNRLQTLSGRRRRRVDNGMHKRTASVAEESDDATAAVKLNWERFAHRPLGGPTRNIRSTTPHRIAAQLDAYQFIRLEPIVRWTSKSKKWKQVAASLHWWIAKCWQVRLAQMLSSILHFIPCHWNVLLSTMTFTISNNLHLE